MRIKPRVVVELGLVGYIVLSIKSSSRAQRKEEARREQVVENLQLDLIALHRAYGIVQERIRMGYYNDKSFDAMMDDFKFERIAFRESQYQGRN